MFAKTTISLLITLVLFARGAVAQDACEDTPFPGTQNVAPFVSKSGHACEPGGYVRTGTPYNTDFFSTVSGSCDVYIWEDPGGCRYDHTQNRGIGATVIEELEAAGATTVNANPLVFPRQLDTRLSGTSTPDTPTWTFNAEGQRTLQFRSHFTSTLCNLPPPSTAVQIEFKAVKCVPDWNWNSQQHLIRNIESQSPPIVVRVPTGMNARMKTGISRAVDAWNTALNGYGAYVGPRYQYTESDTACGGSNCINTEIGPVNLGTECAFATINNAVDTGLILSSTITFPEQSSGWPENFNTRLAAHELGHHLGLGNNSSSCWSDYSLMKPVSCGATFGYPTAPTMSDHLPVARSVYQGQPTATCQ